MLKSIIASLAIALTLTATTVAAPESLLAADATPVVLTETAGPLDQVADTVEVVTGVATSVLEMIMANPLLLAFFTVGFVGIGIGIIRKVKKI